MKHLTALAIFSAMPLLPLALAAEASVADGELPSWLEGRLAAVRPTEREKSFDRIGWAKDIREALRLSRESRRPVFLFTMDGRIHTGRC